MPAKTEHHGRPAAPGIATGPVHRPSTPGWRIRDALGPAEDAAHFRNALDAATAELTDLAARLDEDAAAIVEFQIAMLGDDELTEPVLQAIANGQSAHIAWEEVLDREIAGYEAAEDPYFRARATDLADMRERVLAHLFGETNTVTPPGAILIAYDLTPTAFLGADWSDGGIALEAGSPSSHVAMLARARGVPMVVGLGPLPLGDHESAIVDGVTGVLILNPDATSTSDAGAKSSDYANRQRAELQAATGPAETVDGTAIAVAVNIASPDDLDGLDPADTDGIGLYRTEFLFETSDGLPDEERQYRAYRDVVAWADGRCVTIRTVDAGGDKPVAGLTPEVPEANPFLGLRGLRLSLARPEIFQTQLRALARAAAHGPLQIMLPMVTVPSEFESARIQLDVATASLVEDGVVHTRPPLGLMVEVPAAAFTLERFPADFASIGSNDLVQYMTAAARDNADVAELGSASHPAIRIAIRAAVEGAAKRSMPISICGDAGGDPDMLPKLLAAGLRSVSVAIPALGRTKLAIRAVDLGDAP